jgi:uncharacterized protein YndB with AHSA1/START domain
MNFDSQISAPENEIISIRTIDASREKLFKAWTDPIHLAAWWGPTGFTNTFHEFDIRPQGKWRFIMHGPDGTDYPNESVFIEITEPERIVFDHISPPQFRVTATFQEEEDGKTRLTFAMRFPTAEICSKIKPIVVPANEQNFDRLEAELSKITSSGPGQSF